ncbi:Hypp8699 [Branchiostoma lanceolatum]|uniref:Hypp8699 protein n=1 Tax=Branchiostoma lanceolatum TaxID=7740 RepID=A0A8J9ZAB2_BRALA|nr:Hypp8699 [Branchiostoma lanceolatum]
MIEPTLSPAEISAVHTIGPVLDCMETCGGLSLTECDRIRHELTFVSRFNELVATVNRAGDTCRRLLGASVEVCLPERAPMFPREERGDEIVVLHIGDYDDRLARPLLEQAVQSSSRYGVTVSEDVIEPGDDITDKLLNHLLTRNVRMVVPIITPQALHSRHWSALGYEFSVQNKNLVFPVYAYPEGTRERLLEVLERRCAGMLDMSSAEVPITEEPLSSTKISLLSSEILRKASSSVVLNTYKIKEEGCTLEEDGVIITFPKGCVKTERSLSLEVDMLPIDDALTKAFSAVTPVLTVRQEKEEDFLKPVRVTLPWAWKKGDSNADKVVLMEMKPRPPQWSLLRAEFEETEDAVTFTTSHFCGIAGAKQGSNDEETSTSTGEGLGNQDEAANQQAAEVSTAREEGDQDEAANQKAAEERITREPGSQDEAANQKAARERITREQGNQDEVANQETAEESITRKQGNQDVVANQKAAEERRESNVPSTSTSSTTTEAFQACWNRYTEDKVLLIINPNQATTDNNYIHLMCVHKDDDPTDFFRAANMRPLPPFQQRIVMGREEMIDAKFDEEREVIGDSRDVRDGINFFFPPANCNRSSVGLVLNTPRPAKKNTGTVYFKLFSESGERVTDPRRRIPPATVYLYLDEDETSTNRQRDEAEIGESLALEMKPEKGRVTKSTTPHGGKPHDTDSLTPRPEQEPSDPRTPCLEWLTFDHNFRYPDIPHDLKCIVGHVDITSKAAKRIKRGRCQRAKLVLFNHDIPENTEHYKGTKKAMAAGKKMEDILEDTKNADAVLSLGRRIYNHFETKYKSLGESKPRAHLMFLPRPSATFEAISVRPGGGEWVVLTAGRVTEVEKLKGHDLAARSMGEVAEKIRNVRLLVRGIDEDDWEASKKILEENLKSGRIKPTLLPCGTQEDIAQDMQQAHLVLMPSRAEPFGMIGLEAIAAGIPVLISDKSGLADMITDLIDQNKCPADMRHMIVETSVNESDLDEAAKEWAKRIVDTLKYSTSEFEKAAEFKKKLLESKYWEESHQNLLRVCGLNKDQ